MGLSLSPAPTDRPAPGRSAWQRLLRVCAWCATASSSTPGCCPTCSARPGRTRSPARSTARSSRAGSPASVLAVVGVEAFNEYFDSRMGTDRVFNPADLPPMSDAVLLARHRRVRRRARDRRLPHAARRLADPRLRAARRRGRDLLRGAADPLVLPRPRRARHRARRTDPGWCSAASTCTRGAVVAALPASLVPGCLIMALAVVNAIPDFHQDRLVGKRNLVVRLGRRRAVVRCISRWPAAGLARRADRRRRRRLPVALPRRAARAAAARRRAARRALAPTRRRAPFVPAMRSIVALLPRRGAAAHRRASSSQRRLAPLQP